MYPSALPTDLFDALYTLSILGEDESRDYVLSMTYSGVLDRGEDELAAEAAVEAKLELKRLGEVYYAEGYRLHKTKRQIVGLGFTIPDTAIEWRILSAGYTAGIAMERLFYITR